MILDGDKLDVFNAPIARKKLGITTGGAGGVAVSAGANSQSSGTVQFSNANGVTFGLDGVGVMTASVGAALGGLTNINLSAGTTSQNLSAFTFDNSNGVSFGLDAALSIVTATVATNYQPLGAYLTTAMVSDAGSNFVNTSAALNLTNISATFNSNAISLSVAAVAGQSTQPVAASASNGSFLFSTVAFSNANGVTFGTSAGSIISASVETNYLTTAMASDGGSDFVQATAAFAGTNASGTINSTGISVSVAAAGAASVNFSAGTTSSNLNSVVFSNSNNVTFGLNGSTITMSHQVSLNQILDPNADVKFLMNTRQLQFQWGSNLSTFTTAADRQALLELDVIGNTNFATLSTDNVDVFHIHQSVASLHPYLDLVHLEAAGTNALPLRIIAAGPIAAVMNNPISYDGGSVPMILGTSQSNLVSNLNAFYLEGARSSQFLTSQSNQAASASNGSFTFQTLAFSNANNVTFGTSAGSIITASVGTAAGGGVALSNSQTLFSTGTVALLEGGGAITIASSAGGQSFKFSVPATTALVAAGGIVLSSAGSTVTISNSFIVSAGTTTNNLASLVFSNSNNHSFGLNASTITIDGGYISYLNLAPFFANTITSQFAQSTSYMIPFVVPRPISIGSVRLYEVGTVIASSTQALVNGSTLSMSGRTSHNFVFYTRGTGASSASLQFVTSTQVVDHVSFNVQNTNGANSSQVSYTYRFSLGNTSFTKDYSSTAQSYNYHTSNVTDLTGTKMVDYPCGVSLSAGQWFLAYGRSTTQATQNAVISGATRLNISYESQFIASQNTQGAIGTLGGATNSSVQFGMMGLGSFTTGGAAGTTASLHHSVISSGVSNQVPLFQLVRIV